MIQKEKSPLCFTLRDSKLPFVYLSEDLGVPLW